jgi:hypothetical protein
MSDKSIGRNPPNTSTERPPAPKGSGSSCKYCQATAASARIEADGSRTNVCADHNPICGLCRHFVSGDGPMGECHFRSPVVVVAQDNVVAAYPDVEAKAIGCWEGFKPR